MTDIDGLIKRLDELIVDQRGVDADTLREVRGCLEALRAEVERLKIALQRVIDNRPNYSADIAISALSGLEPLSKLPSEYAGLRVAEEREACLAIVADERKYWLHNTNLACDQIEAAIRSRSTTKPQVSQQDIGNAIAEAHRIRPLIDAEIAARSSTPAQDTAPSPIGCADEEVEALGWVIAQARSEYSLSDKSKDEDDYLAESVLSHLRAQRKASDDDVAASPISQEGSIAPEALSEGGE